MWSLNKKNKVGISKLKTGGEIYKEVEEEEIMNESFQSLHSGNWPNGKRGSLQVVGIEGHCSGTAWNKHDWKNWM